MREGGTFWGGVKTGRRDGMYGRLCVTQGIFKTCRCGHVNMSGVCVY